MVRSWSGYIIDMPLMIHLVLMMVSSLFHALCNPLQKGKANRTTVCLRISSASDNSVSHRNPFTGPNTANSQFSNTNVYEERSLGIYANDETPDTPSHTSRSNVLMDLVRHHLGRPAPTETSRGYFVHQQLRSQLSHDIWWIALAVLFIAIAESDHFTQQPVAFSTFNIIFEVVSAYGCVGVSVGYPGKNSSFCGAWHVISKLILAAVALRGRHRGLPVAIDRAIMLPRESLAWAEEEDAALRKEQSKAWGQDRMPVGAV